ncbi:MAG: hypothetical protein QOG31_1674 [Thermoplasmata archaeon]|jgi:hypothetical protein|nr:hypothetical protein [Thermoplasmata archaeon]
MSPDDTGASPASPPRRLQLSPLWIWRGVAVALILFQVGYVASVVPLQDRWFLHSDDHGKYVQASFIMERGTPTTPLPGLQYTEFPAAFAPFGMVVKGAEASSYSGPGYSYLLAPVTLLGPEAVFLFAELLLVLTLLAVYFLLEASFGGLAATAGMALFGFSAPIVYWGPLLYASIPGVGLLALALLLLNRGTRRSEVAALSVGALAAFYRYEFILFMVAVGAAWLAKSIRQGRRLPYFWPHATVAGIGAAMFFLVSYVLTGKLNFVAANANPAAATSGSVDVEQTVELTLGHIRLANIHYYYDLLFVTIFLIPSLLVAATFFLPRRRPWSFAPLFAMMGLFTAFVLGNLFFPQKHILDHSPNRYLIPLLLCAALAVAFLLTRVGTVAQKTLACCAVALFCVGSTALAAGEEGLAGNKAYLEIANGTVAAAKAFPADTVFVGEHLDKMLVGRMVLNPLNLPAAQQYQETLSILQKVLADGHPVYVSRIYDDQYRSWVMASETMQLAPAGRWFYEIKLRA